MTVYETDVKVVGTGYGEEEDEMRLPFIRATAVVEQRISHFLMALALIGTMTGPLLVVLHTMPTALFAGVFFIVGVRSLRPFATKHWPTKACPTGGARGLPVKTLCSQRSDLEFPR